METQDKAYGLTEKQKAYIKWVDLLKENKLFTPGLAYWHSEIDRDIVSDFIDKFSVPKADRPRLFTANHDIFNVADPVVTITVGDKEIKFNIARQLYLCPLQTWPALSTHLEGCGFCSKVTQGFYRLIHQYDIPIQDPGALQYNMLGDMVKVDAFSLYSNKKCNVFQYINDKPLLLPKAIQVPESSVCVEDGKLLFKSI